MNRQLEAKNIIMTEGRINIIHQRETNSSTVKFRLDKYCTNLITN